MGENVGIPADYVCYRRSCRNKGFCATAVQRGMRIGEMLEPDLYVKEGMIWCRNFELGKVERKEKKKK